MARKTATTAAAPSPDPKEKAGATKPAKAAAKPAEAPKAVTEPKTPVTPAVAEAGGDDNTVTPPDGVSLPPIVAAAVLAMASSGEKGAGEDGEGPDDLPSEGAAEGLIEEAGPFVFALPVVTEFPVVLTLTNAWRGRHHVAGTNETLAPGETRAVEFTEQGFDRFSQKLIQLADLNGWTEGQGILIEQGEQNAED